MAMIQIYYNQFVSQMGRLSGLWLLATRLWMARVFWQSGMVKLDDWESALLLFRDEYQVPILPYELAAYSATAFELICPILLAIGFLTRLAAFPLVVMTLVIQFTYLQHDQHYYWLFLLSALVCFGAGKFSLDHWMDRKKHEE